MCITLLLVVEIEVAEVAVAVRDMRRDSVRGRLPQPRGGYLKQGAQIQSYTERTRVVRCSERE